MNTYRLLNEIMSIVPVFPIYYYGRKVYIKLEKELKIYWIFLVFAFIFQLTLVISSRCKINNLFILALFQFAEYAVLSVIFYMWNRNLFIRRIILVFVLVNLISTIIYLSGTEIDYAATLDKYLRNYILIPLSFYTAYNFAIESKSDLITDIKFWFLGGILLNVTLTAFAQIYWTYTYKSPELSMWLELFLLIINTLAYIMFIKGFLCLKTQMKYTGSYH